jgi:hypothetical protein
VALKILPPEMAANPENIQRFHQEARAAAKLDHENIARVFFCGEDQGLHFISFEFVEGENLRTILEKRGRLAVPEAVNYLLQIATGLAHAAGRGVVHRDIKPSNIIITPTGRAKLVDMGLARSMEPQHDLALTQSGVTLGTFDYISPEQALEPREADVRSDIYSLGCTFYHLLTGKPPVPEGTAAKKLHHHQNVGPVDPRQLNPAIPDEVAAILARMMAKDPNDRYQRAEHLVQHLLQQAHKLGAIAEVPEGVLFMDTPLPSPPRLRPALQVIAAAILLVAFVIVEGIFAPAGPSGNRRDGETAKGRERELPAAVSPFEGVANSQALESGSSGPKLPNKTPDGNARRPVAVKNGRELAAVLRQQHPNLNVLLDNDVFDLNQERGANREVPGFVFQGRELQLTIEPKDPRKRSVIRLTYEADIVAGAKDVLAPLTIKGGKVALKNLRFEIDAALAPRILMAAVRLQEGGQLYLHNCEFIQTGAGRDGRLSSVLVEGPRNDEPLPVLLVKECYFESRESNGAASRGQDAITLDGPAKVELTNCGFAPHPALVHFLENKGPRGNLTLDHCSVILTDGAAFQVDQEAWCDLLVKNSIISCPVAPVASSSALIQQNGDEPKQVHYVGQGNLYHNLTDYWIKGPFFFGEDAWPAFLRELEQTEGKDSSTPLATSPWLDKNPVQTIRNGKPNLAFQVDPNRKELRQTNGPADHLVGMERCAWGPLYEGKLPSLEETKPGRPTALLVVDPTVAKPGNGVYSTLDQAASAANPGDTIEIKHARDNRLVPVDMVRFEKPDIDLTIKAAAGFHPILTLGQSTDPDAALFRLHDGKLTLEGLEFQLTSDQNPFQSRAVVAVVSNGECHFNQCVATLDRGDGVPDMVLALVTVIDPSKVMQMGGGPGRQFPDLHLEKCFVRGKGELVAVRGSRTFNLHAENSLVVLDGNFLVVEGTANGQNAAIPALISLSRVTTFLTDHLVCLRGTREIGKNGRGLIQTQVTPSECLFASPEGKSSLVHLDNLDVNRVPAGVKAFFSWNNAQNNVYSNYKEMLDQKPIDDGTMTPQPFDTPKWASFTMESKPRFDSLRFSALKAEPSLTRVTPAEFQIDSAVNSGTWGADINELPTPYSANSTGAAGGARK